MLERRSNEFACAGTRIFVIRIAVITLFAVGFLLDAVAATRAGHRLAETCVFLAIIACSIVRGGAGRGVLRTIITLLSAVIIVIAAERTVLPA